MSMYLLSFYEWMSEVSAALIPFKELTYASEQEGQYIVVHCMLACLNAVQFSSRPLGCTQASKL